VDRLIPEVLGSTTPGSMLDPDKASRAAAGTQHIASSTRAEKSLQLDKDHPKVDWPGYL
jgi:hypothetical protein